MDGLSYMYHTTCSIRQYNVNFGRSLNYRSKVRAFAFCSKWNSARTEMEQNKAKNGTERNNM